jgi:hypothetical protein
MPEDETPPPTPSNAATIVAKIEAHLAGKADLATASYTIAGPGGGTRTLSRCTHTELLNLHKYWRAILTREQGRHLRGIRIDY